MIKFTIDGEPVAKGRPRATAKSGFVKIYTPKTTVHYEKLVADLASLQMRGREPFLGAVSVTLCAYMPIPKSKSKKWQQEAVAGVIVPTTKPDIDNLAKSVLDAVNGIIFKDDKQIAQLTVKKRYSDKPRVEVVIQSLFNE